MVKAKEKALEIFNEHYFYLRANLMHDEEAKEDALECALITINQIIGIKLLWFQKNTKELDYWQEVKQEIENMRNPSERQITH